MLLRPSSIAQITFSPLGGLYSYLLSLPNQVIFIPLLDPVGTTNPRVYNPALVKGRNIVVNGTFDSDTVWNKGAGWTISAGAAHKAAGTGSNLFQAVPITPSVIYENIFTLLNRAAGSIIPIMGNSGTGGIARNADGTYTQNLTAAGTANYFLFGDAALIADIDNVSVKQLNIPENSMTATATGALARGDYWSFDGNDLINFYSNSFNSAFNPDEGSINILLNPATNIAMPAVRIRSDANNEIRIQFSATNTLNMFYRSGGSLKTINQVISNYIDKFNMFTLTWSISADEVKFYMNGIQIGTTLTGIVQWSGNLASTFVALGEAGSAYYLGNMRLFQIFNTALPAATIANIYALSGL